MQPREALMTKRTHVALALAVTCLFTPASDVQAQAGISQDPVPLGGSEYLGVVQDLSGTRSTPVDWRSPGPGSR